MPSIPRIRRRDLLAASAAAGAAAMFPFPAIAKEKSPNEKLAIAGIGAGGQGGWDIDNCAGENIVALCDVDDRRCEGSVAHFRKAKRYRDFRKMFDEMGKQIDAVVVGTPDHTHAPAAAMAMRLHKHCYCEKPLTHTVYEARVLAGIAREKNLATQMGTQIHAESNYRRVVELVQAGAIGPIRDVHVWLGANFDGPPKPVGGRQNDAPKQGQPVPSTLDWDLWLGPAPFRPYQWDLCAIPVALLVGIRQRRPGRFLLPLLRLGLLGLEAPASHNGRGRRAGPPRKRRTSGPSPARSIQPAAICRR